MSGKGWGRRLGKSARLLVAQRGSWPDFVRLAGFRLLFMRASIAAEVERGTDLCKGKEQGPGERCETACVTGAQLVPIPRLAGF